jgi:hypothetical protein
LVAMWATNFAILEAHINIYNVVSHNSFSTRLVYEYIHI